MAVIFGVQRVSGTAVFGQQVGGTVNATIPEIELGIQVQLRAGDVGNLTLTLADLRFIARAVWEYSDALTVKKFLGLK